MTIKPGKFAETWKAAKLRFQTTTGIKKPAETLAFFRLGTGVESALKKLDTLSAKSHRNPSDYEKYRVATEAYYTGSFKTYQAKLGAELKSAQANKNIPKGTTKSKYVTGLTQMVDDLGDITGAVRKHNAQSLTASGLVGRTRDACAAAMEFVADVTRNPLPDTFNTGILKAARDINQKIGNVQKLKDEGLDIGRDEPSNLFEVLRPWAGGQRKLPKTATRAEVLREVGAFKQAVQAAAKWAR